MIGLYLVVSKVTENTSSIFYPVLDIILANTGLLSKLFVVAVNSFMNGDDQIEDGFGFWGDLSESDAATEDSSAGDVVGIELLFWLQGLEDLCNLELGDGWWGVGKH